MVTYYKATRLDGTDFYTGTVDYAAALASGEVIRHSAKKVPDDSSTYFSLSISPTDCIGFKWPCRLFRVEPVGRVIARLIASSNKRAVSALRVVEELPAHMALGPNGVQLAAFIEKVQKLPPKQICVLDAVQRRYQGDWFIQSHKNNAYHAAYRANREPASQAVCAAVRAATRRAVWDAAVAILVRDLISPEDYAILTKPFRDAGLGELV